MGGPRRASASQIQFKKHSKGELVFLPSLDEFDRGGKPSVTLVLASSRQNSPLAI